MHKDRGRTLIKSARQNIPLMPLGWKLAGERVGPRRQVDGRGLDRNSLRLGNAGVVGVNRGLKPCLHPSVGRMSEAKSRASHHRRACGLPRSPLTSLYSYAYIPLPCPPRGAIMRRRAGGTDRGKGGKSPELDGRPGRDLRHSAGAAPAGVTRTHAPGRRGGSPRGY
jgi:hypothetical protein